MGFVCQDHLHWLLNEAIAAEDLDHAHFVCKRMKNIMDLLSPHSYIRLGCACEDHFVWLLNEAIASNDLVMAHTFGMRMKTIVVRAAQQFLRKARL